VAIQTFEISKGKTFVAGLFWQTLTRPQKIKEEIKKLATDLEFDFYIVRDSTVPQVGLLSSHEGATIGMMSCAAVISKATEMQGGLGSSLVATKIPDGRYIFVAVRDAAILPDCDFIADEDTVEQFYNAQLSMGEWHNRIAPDHWGVEGAIERDFLDIIPSKNSKITFHSWWGILPVGGEKKKIVTLFFIMALLAGLGFAAYTKYNEIKSSENNEILLAEQTQQKASKLAVLSQIQIPHPWVEMAIAKDFMKACEAAFKNKYIFAGGWQMSEFTCDAGAANYKWQRQGTTFADLKNVVAEATSDELGDVATFSFPFALNSTTEDMLLNDARNVFIERLQKIGLKFSLASVPVVIPSPPGADADFVPPVADYSNFHWQIGESRLRPVTIGDILDIPGVRISKVLLNSKEGTLGWSYEGEIYEKN